MIDANAWERQTAQAYDGLAGAVGRELVGVPELAARWGVTEGWARALTRRGDFPEPVATVYRRPVWNGRKLDEWRHQSRRRRPALVGSET